MADYISTDPTAGLEEQKQYLSTDPNFGLDQTQPDSVPSLSDQVIQPKLGLADMLFDPETAQNLRGAIQDIAYSIPGMITAFPKGAYQLAKFQFGSPQQQGQAIGEIAGQGVGMGRQVASDIQAPLGSRESFRGIANLGMMAAPAVGEALGEAALMGRTKPPVQSITPITDAISEIPKPEEVIPSAQQISEPTQVHGDVLNAPRPQEGVGEMPANVGGEGVPPRGQGEIVQQTPQEIAPVPQPEQPAPVSEPAIPNSLTSLKNAIVDQEREARGLPSAVTPARQGFGELWDRVSQKIDQDPNYPDQVIESLKNNKRAMTAEEDAALLHRQVDLQNQYAKANQGVIDARSAGDETALADASARSKALSDQLLEVYDIGKSGGRETALGLNARKLLANEDFSLGNMITEKRADKMGAELTPQEIEQVTKAHDKINANRIALDAYETSPRAESYRRQLQKWTEEYRQKTAAGDFAPKLRRPMLMDADAVKAKSEFERSKLDWQRARVQDQAENRTASQKFWDRFVGVERAMKLTSDVVLTKLTAAAAVREAGLSPLEQVVGSGTRRIIPGIAAKAPRYGGGFSLDSEINAKQQMFTQGMKDAWQNLKMKQSDLDELYKTGKIKAPDEFYDYMGYLHGALKAPIKRAEFARSLTERMKWAAKNGQDLNNQSVMRQLSEQAYVDANRSIFLQDNIVSKSMNLLNNYLKTQKIAPNLGPALARINQFLVPIVKIPTNIVGEVSEGIHGVASGSTRAALAYMKGLSTLEPAQADLIMRQINKGLIGNALILTGYLLRNKVGGFYHDQDKRTPSDVQPGRYRIGGVDLPASAGHSTGAMLLNIGATIGRVAEEQQKKTSPGTKGAVEGLRAAGAGLAHEIPFVPAATGIVDAMDSKGGFQKYINGMITSSTTPALLSHIAKIADTPGTFPKNILEEPTKRKPTTPVEALKIGIPGLRQTVPEKAERLSKKGLR